MRKNANSNLGRDDASRCQTLIGLAEKGDVNAAVTLGTFYSKSKLTRVVKANVPTEQQKTFIELIRSQTKRHQVEVREKNSTQER